MAPTIGKIMKTSLATNRVQIRFTDEEFNLIKEESLRRDLTVPQTAKILLLEILSGFDQKQEFFLRRLDKQDEQLALLPLLLQISTIGAAAGALPLASENQDIELLRKQILFHFKESRVLGDSLLNMIKKGSI